MTTMNPLHLLRGLYRQLKTPVMHVSKELQRNKNAAATATSKDKSRSNASTRFLIQQYRMASLSSPDSDATTKVDHTTTKDNTMQHQHRFATELYLLRQDIQQRGELYLIDTGADQQLSARELSRRAAARAGLQLPEQYKE